ELLAADGGLHVERLEIVAQVAVDVLVVVALGQRAEAPAEPLAAGVVLPRGAPAIAAPIAERLGDAAQAAGAGEHGAPFAHRQVVRRIKTLRRQMAERAGAAPAILASQCVAVVF